MFYDRWEDLRQKKGVSRQKACEDCGYARTAWNKWKLGAVPNGDGLQTIADYFGVTADYLLTGEETKKAPTPEGERKISDDDIMFALWGDSDDVDKDDLDDVKRYAAFVQERKKQK